MRAWRRCSEHCQLTGRCFRIWQPSAPEIAPFPAGLNDCVSGFRWVVDHAGELGVDPDRIVVTDAHRKNVFDPMTGSMLRVPGTAELMATVRPRCARGSMCPQWIAEATLKITIV